MKVKDLYWAARNSTFFINLESEGRPLLCEPRLSDEGGVRIRLWLRDPAGTGTGSAVGKQVTVNDRSGASADIDIQVNYSLDPSAAEYLYSEYGKQQTFTQNYISNDLRSVAREQSGRFDTLTMLTNRGEYTKAVQDVLAAKWRKIGLTVEQVSVQDVRYGEAITKKYTEAQAAEVDKQKALNEQQVAKTEAETKKIKAQGEADANAVLNESLTDNVLKQHYIDALSNADQLVVVPDGADTLVQTK